MVIDSEMDETPQSCHLTPKTKVSKNTTTSPASGATPNFRKVHGERIHSH